MKRLTVNRLVSIGAVTDGDNPEAEILLYKKRVAKHDIPGSLDDRLRRIRDAWWDQHGETEGPYIDSIFESFVIIQDGAETFRVAYTETEDGVMFGSRTAVSVDTTIVEKRLWKSDNITENTDSVDNARDTDMSDLDLSAVADDLRAEIEKTLEGYEARIAELESPTDEDITKGMSDEVKAEFERLEKAAADNAEALAKERNERLTVVWIGKARSFEKILGDAEESAPFLKGMEPETSDWLLGKLQTAEKLLEKSDLLKELGSSDDEADPSGKIAKLADEKRKENPTLTPARARALVREENPDLVAAERSL